MPSSRVDRGGPVAHIVGMAAPSADISSQDAGLGAFFRSSDLDAAGLSRHQLPRLLRSGAVERMGRGLYRRTDAEPSEHYSLAMACAAVPQSIVCLLSALQVHDIGTQAPSAIWLAIPHKARLPKLQAPKLRIVRFSGPAWTYGVSDTTFEGVPARITSPARTIADCFRFERLVGAEAAIEALDDGLRQHKVSVAELERLLEVLPSRRLRVALAVLQR
jgi:predicted transcriptional regulator of viral defense system